MLPGDSQRPVGRNGIRILGFDAIFFQSVFESTPGDERISRMLILIDVGFIGKILLHVFVVVLMIGHEVAEHRDVRAHL